MPQTDELNEDIFDLASTITNWTITFLSYLGVSNQWIRYINVLLLLLLTVIIVYTLQLVARKLLTFILIKAEKITKIKFLSYLGKNRLPHFFALVVPFSFMQRAIPIVFYDFKFWIKPLTKILDIFLVFIVIWTIMAFVRSGADFLKKKKAFYGKPLNSYMQVIQIILYIFGAVVIYSILTGKSPTAFFAAMGAASAVLMLMFKDTIMGFVASIQISTNNMVQIGDWITMNKYGADGNVEEINLTTVKVRNFDNTITTIPTYSLISDSFQNWRGMQKSGIRRFVHFIIIKQNDIRFLNEYDFEKFKKIKEVNSYIEKKQKEYSEFNKKNKADMTNPLNGLNLTNADAFIEYVISILKKHPGIDGKSAIMFRHRESTSSGLQIQLYAFINTIVTAEYEAVKSEILNYIIASVSYFDLSVFEDNSGTDGLDVRLIK